MIKKVTEYRPDLPIPPGETLEEVLNSFEMSQAELAKRIGITTKHLNEIIKGKAPITAETALKLESVFKTPASFWNNLETNYRETKARLEQETKIKEEASLIKEIPYPAMSSLGWIPSTRNPEERVINLRKFFGVASLNYITKVMPIAYRKAKGEEASPLALAAWIRKGELLAYELDVSSYNEEKLIEIVPQLRKLTCMEEPDFIGKLVSLCASCGIATVFVPYLPKTYANGVTKWLTPNKALIQLSTRGAYADIIWFTFFHELGHLISHSKKAVFIEDGVKNDEETEADNFATKTLIPPKLYKKYINKRDFSVTSIRRFAKEIGVHKCIVIGRLLHDGLINYNQYGNERPQFRFAY